MSDNNPLQPIHNPTQENIAQAEQIKDWAVKFLKENPLPDNVEHIFIQVCFTGGLLVVIDLTSLSAIPTSGVIH